jgi:hypothetical protein
VSGYLVIVGDMNSNTNSILCVVCGYSGDDGVPFEQHKRCRWQKLKKGQTISKTL